MIMISLYKMQRKQKHNHDISNDTITKHNPTQNEKIKTQTHHNNKFIFISNNKTIQTTTHTNTHRKTKQS